jgi:hypothetical protein
MIGKSDYTPLQTKKALEGAPRARKKKKREKKNTKKVAKIKKKGKE